LAVVRKNPEGKVKIEETGDMSFGPGAGIGAVVGGALGLFAGPGGLVAGAAAGDVIGGAAASLASGLLIVLLFRLRSARKWMGVSPARCPADVSTRAVELASDRLRFLESR
jgi:hypothetical protein